MFVLRRVVVLAVCGSLAAAAGISLLVALGFPGRTVVAQPAAGPITTGWVVSVQYDAPAHNIHHRHSCTGSLAGSRHTVITAAHCVTTDTDGNSPDGIAMADKVMRVRVGSPNRAGGGELVDVIGVTAHPDWQWAPGADIAVLHLAREVAQQPIALASIAQAPGTPITLYGWGAPTPQDPPAHNIHRRDTVVAEPTRCADTEITAREVCAGNPSGTSGSCPGDSGGPVVTLHSSTPALVGVMSRSLAIPCTAATTSLTSVPDYRDWIAATVRAGPPTPTASWTSWWWPPAAGSAVLLVVLFVAAHRRNGVRDPTRTVRYSSALRRQRPPPPHGAARSGHFPALTCTVSSWSQRRSKNPASGCYLLGESPLICTPTPGIFWLLAGTSATAIMAIVEQATENRSLATMTAVVCALVAGFLIEPSMRALTNLGSDPHGAPGRVFAPATGTEQPTRSQGGGSESGPGS